MRAGAISSRADRRVDHAQSGQDGVDLALGGGEVVLGTDQVVGRADQRLASRGRLDERENGAREIGWIIGQQQVAAVLDRGPSAPRVVETTGVLQAKASRILKRVPDSQRSGTSAATLARR